MVYIKAEKLAGRLERVFINEFSSKNCAWGFLDEDPEKVVLVSHGENYLQKTCIVKFDLNPEQREHCPPRSNFITSIIPENFISMNKNGYVLLGFWKKQSYPETLNEINEIYNPGDMAKVIYFPMDLSTYLITKDGLAFMGMQDSRYAIEKDTLQNPLLATRVMLFENPGEIAQAKKLLLEKDLIGIEMEPWKK
jgi:hypothetical protein